MEPADTELIEPAPPAAPGGNSRPEWQVVSYGLSDRGKVRPNNEDVFVVGELVRTLLVHHTNIPQPESGHGSHRGYVFLVADGVGGSRAGEVASRLSAMEVEEFMLNALRRFTNLEADDEQGALRDLQSALRRADARLFDESDRHPEWSGMGTTLTLAFAVDGRLFVAHAGDSRCYLLSAGELRQLTQDHTVAAELARKGLISPDDQQHHPWRHAVTNLLGGPDQGVHVEVHSLELRAGDVILLCSDGLTEMVPDDPIAAVLAAEPDPQKACEKLVSEAIRAGGRDNVTVIVARVVETPSST